MRTLLISTTDTLGPLVRMLEIAEPAARAVGAVLAGAGHAEPAAAIEPGMPPVLGALGDLSSVCRSYGVERAIVSLPAGLSERHLAARAELNKLGVVERVVPPLDEQLASEPEPVGLAVQGPQPRLDIAALVGRATRAIDRGLVEQTIAGKTVLVTGAGGSIGSEITRICARFNPKRIILIERAENALFEIDRQLASRFPSLDRVALLHDVVDAERTGAHFARHAPDVVFHAAAHKHVPLMETHPAHALSNNLFGTISVASAAAAVGAERFVLISTDKAVNPKSVMGATKRLAERFVRWLATRTDHTTRMSMVRFGNVLGSAGSVLPIWANQIAEGGPITLTDDRMTRYFMTIPEAAALVIQAGAMSGGAGASGEVFVLDMGEPVRIVELAERFIRAHGFEPARDRINEPRPSGSGPARPTIPIAVTGIRPGEKLHEQLVYQAEALGPTEHAAVRRLIDASDPALGVEQMLADCAGVRSSRAPSEVLAVLARHVPELAQRAAALSETKLGITAEAA